jgi:hypothetical protein
MLGAEVHWRWHSLFKALMMMLKKKKILTGVTVTTPQTTEAVRSGAVVTGWDVLQAIPGVAVAIFVQLVVLFGHHGPEDCHFILPFLSGLLGRLLELHELVLCLVVRSTKVTCLLTGRLGVDHELLH